jgi:hypothetical protein
MVWIFQVSRDSKLYNRFLRDGQVYPSHVALANHLLVHLLVK